MTSDSTSLVVVYLDSEFAPEFWKYAFLAESSSLTPQRLTSTFNIDEVDIMRCNVNLRNC